MLFDDLVYTAVGMTSRQAVSPECPKVNRFADLRSGDTLNGPNTTERREIPRRINATASETLSASKLLLKAVISPQNAQETRVRPVARGSGLNKLLECAFQKVRLRAERCGVQESRHCVCIAGAECSRRDDLRATGSDIFGIDVSGLFRTLSVCCRVDADVRHDDKDR